MIVIAALLAPISFGVVMTARSERVSRHGSLVTLCEDAPRELRAVPRTAASPDRWPASATASTSSSYPDEGAGVAVVFQPNDGLQATPAPAGSDDPVPSMLATVKRMTGWSWDRMAESLGRSRQAVHGWTLGKEISEQNLERLAKLHATLSFIDRGSAEANRALLHAPTADGRLVADLLNEGRFDEVRSLLGKGVERPDPARLRAAVGARQDEGGAHWFDRLAETRGEEQPLEIIPSGERKRLALRRRG